MKKVRRAIPDSDWNMIKLALPAEIKPFILLAYHYGLRRSEAMGFSSLDCVFEDELEVSQQLESPVIKQALFDTLLQSPLLIFNDQRWRPRTPH